MNISWYEKAACRSSSVGLFFAERDDPQAPAKLSEARSICSLCPVVAECADAGRREPAGMWGGLTAEERRVTRALRTRVAG